MHTDLLMHVAALHIQDQIDVASSRRQAREARRETKSRAVGLPRRPLWQLRRPPARPVSPAS